LKRFEIKREARLKRHRRVRKTVSGTSERPRLSIYKSARHIYAQVIDDDSGRTLAAASSLTLRSAEEGQGDKKARAKTVGKLIAEAARKVEIRKVVLDRGGYRYHGRVKALADGARESGLEF